MNYLKQVVADPPSRVRAAITIRILSLIAMSGAGIFAIAEIAQPFYRSDRALSDPYSRYAVGKYGFVQTIAFIALSAGSFALWRGFSRYASSAMGWRAGRTLLVLWSAGVLVAAIFPFADGPVHASATIHSLASMLSFVAIIAAMLVLSRVFEQRPKWKPFAFSSWLFGLAGGGSFLLAAIIHHPTCFAILQRIFLGAVVLWISATAAHMRKLASR